MPVNPLDVLRITAKFSQASQQIRNVYDVIHGGLTQQTDADVWNGVLLWLELAYTFVQPGQTSQFSYDTIDIVNVTQGLPIIEVAWPNLSAGGDVNNDPLPLQIAAVCRFPTNYLRSQGRKFVGGLTENQTQGNGVLIPTTVTAHASYAARIAAGFTVNGDLFVAGADNPSKARFAAFTASIVNDVVGTQRRRKQGVGI